MPPKTAKINSKPANWKQRVKLLAKTCLAFLISLPVIYLLLSWIFPFPREKLDLGRPAVLVLDRQSDVLRAFIGEEDMWRIPIPLDECSPWLIKATVAVEDERFWQHPGVDPIAIARAFLTNVTRRRVVSGASTITMQIIRMIGRRPRTIKSKIIEAFRALQLERICEKDSVLECYLNMAPYGGNYVGVEAASRRYFRKRAKDLTLAEAALLAGLPQSPTRLRPDRHPQRAKRRRDHVLRRMLECNYITKDMFRDAMSQPVIAGNHRFPFKAPHLAELALRRARDQVVVRTTLDAAIQSIVEKTLYEAADSLRPLGVSNCAAVVIENESGAVRALVGARDFFSREDSGQVNGALAQRSPGSALKPFTYALAIEKGICTPGLTLADVPHDYAGYAPVNYDRRFYGPVTAREALAASLNVPAVKLLQQVGVRELQEFLRDAGITTLTKSPKTYGLALTLGGVGVRLLELTNAYAALARLGVYKPYRIVDSDRLAAHRYDSKLGDLRPGLALRSGSILQQTDAEQRILSAGAAYLVADILSDTTRLGPTAQFRAKTGSARIAWKTGTSFGHRDAWTIGYNPAFTVGVWLGNFSGRPAKTLVGISAAAPVVMRIFDQLYKDKPSGWYIRPEEVGVRTVCAVSGMTVGSCCDDTTTDLYLKNRTHIPPCAVHREIMIDDATGFRLCRYCARNRRVRFERFEVWGAEMNDWLLKNGRCIRRLPAHFPGCTQVRRNGAPKIVSPTRNRGYVLISDSVTASRKLLLHALLSPGVRELYWFVDGLLYRRAAVGEQIFWPMKAGRHKITCIDDEGRSDFAVIVVKK